MKIGVTERGDAGLDFSWMSFKGPKILITKSPQNFLNFFGDPICNFNDCIIHCTITGLGGTPWEPNVSPIDITLYAYNRLVEEFGGDRVVLRIDPIIIGVSDKNIFKVLDNVRGRLRISFLDMYDHVRERIKQNNIEMPGFHMGFHANSHYRQSWVDRIDSCLKEKYPNRTVEVCGEPGLMCTGCVSEKDFNALNIDIPLGVELKGQRKYCQCLAEKEELLKNMHPCKHNCIYCYWK